MNTSISKPQMIPCRVHIILARKAPVAIAIRRGPSKRVCTVGWDRTKDTFHDVHGNGIGEVRSGTRENHLHLGRDVVDLDTPSRAHFLPTANIFGIVRALAA